MVKVLVMEQAHIKLSNWHSLWGLGGDDFRALVKGVVPVASLGVGVGVEQRQ